MSAGDALAAIKTRAEGHTEGPWRVWKHGHGLRSAGVETVQSYEGREPDQITDWCLPADAELIAAAPRLLAALEAVGKVDKYHRSKGMSTSETCLADGWDMALSHVRKAIEEALS